MSAIRKILSEYQIHQHYGLSWFVLFESGSLPLRVFRQINEMSSASLRTLYSHPDLYSLIPYGPWLLKIESNNDPSLDVLIQHDGVLGLLLSSLTLTELADQLSYGCVVKQPNNKGIVLRFYNPSALPKLARRSDLPWHYPLFSGIKQWWFPHRGAEWQQLSFTPVSAKYATLVKIVHLDEALFSELTGDTEVTVVLKMWQKFPQSHSCPRCVRRDRVFHALELATQNFLQTSSDRRIFALCYLLYGKKGLESEQMSNALQRVHQDKVALSQALKYGEE
ncbi:DUF4123 domain-containing protein [Hafnia alvei]|uniref:DUF4123 domain-containing protein n=1 Tax=Hafnia alvei TaxID=569 RepID=UPI001F22F855|nr:DUF4123 domain-containing protein [Hafnia alvei]MCE9872953.1 DUF4123 domain-containing protein [Hafnia alvei]